MVNLNFLGIVYMVFVMVVQFFGEEEGFVYFMWLYCNVNQYMKLGAVFICVVVCGEMGIGIVFLYDVHIQVVVGFFIEVVVLVEGIGYEVGGISFICGVCYLDSVKVFMDYVLSAEVQLFLVEVDVF